MRAICLSLSGLLLCMTGVLAQQGGAPAAPQAAPDPRLDSVLKGWEQAMTNLTSFQAQCVQTIVDKTFNTTEVFEGEALFLKGQGPKQPSRASLYLKNKKNPQSYLKYICTGTFLYEYAPAQKEIRVHDLPPAKDGQIGDDNFLQFLFGMKADEAKQRYQMTYVPAPPDQAKWYNFLQIRPKLPQDKQDFQEARLTLWAESSLPRELWYVQPNLNTIRWDFVKVERNVRLAPSTFDPPSAVPAGWSVKRIDARALANTNAPRPTVVRPQSR